MPVLLLMFPSQDLQPNRNRIVQDTRRTLSDWKSPSGFQRTFRLPPVMVTLTKRRVYLRRFRARPLGSFFFSCFSTCTSGKKTHQQTIPSKTSLVVHRPISYHPCHISSPSHFSSSVGRKKKVGLKNPPLPSGDDEHLSHSDTKGPEIKNSATRINPP